LGTEQNDCALESYALVVTYKVGIIGNIPATNGSIKGCGPSEHPKLKEEEKIRLRPLVSSENTQQ
jgi:hypothetical protein